ncbi:MAG: glycosyltransferase family 2 protein [Planctomycetes bacterium]|nr:glycosyltransferase family 2 protein [Planctomycetota bacterium]
MIRLIIPAYNEAANLPGVLERLRSTLAGGAEPYQVFAVEDGSSDDTAEVLRRLAREHPLTPLFHETNRGVAAAFRTGFAGALAGAADDDVVVLMEGDGTSAVESIPAMAARIRAGADVVVASRYRVGGGYRRFPLKRLILSCGANLVVSLLFPIPGVRDYTIFFRAYRAGPLKLAMARHGDQFITVDTFFANVEVLLNLRPCARRLEEIPFLYDYGRKQGKSGMKVWHNLRSYLGFIARHFLG